MTDDILRQASGVASAAALAQAVIAIGNIHWAFYADYLKRTDDADEARSMATMATHMMLRNQREIEREQQGEPS